MNIDIPVEVSRNAQISDLNRNYRVGVQPILALNRDAIVNMILNILQTEKGSYPFEPTFGTNLERYLFRLGTEETISEIESEVLTALSQWMPYARVGPSDVIAYKISSFEVVVEISILTKEGRGTYAFKLATEGNGA
jgi:phage baseplate assembly protein W